MLKQKAKNTLVSAFGPGYVARDGINFTVSCPECDSSKSKRKLSIRMDDFRYHCWVCGLKGKNIWKYISRKFPGVFIDPLLFKSNPADQIDTKLENPPLELPKNLTPVFNDNRDPDVRAVKNYLLRRGLSLANLTRWRVMTSRHGKFRRRAVIPSFDSDGNINYYVGRSIDECGFKYLNAKVPKHDVIFNEIDIDWDKTIVLVEGVFDAMKSIENTIPILGSTLPTNSTLFRRLMKKQSRVVVSLDPDLKKKSLKIAKDLYEAGCDVRLCFTPDGKDMGDLSKEENRKMIYLSETFTPLSTLSHKINSIRSGSII